MMMSLAVVIIASCPGSRELVAGKIGKVVQRLDAVLAQRHQHGRGEALDPGDIFVTPSA